MRVHERGCTEKCRIKNTALELDLSRNQNLVNQLTGFDWCDLCNSGSLQKNAGPNSGSRNGLPACTNSCGMRLVQACKPVMEEYGASETRIKALNDKYKKLELRDVSFQKYQEQQETFKNAEVRLKYDATKENVGDLIDMLGANKGHRRVVSLDDGQFQKTFLQQ